MREEEEGGKGMKVDLKKVCRRKGRYMFRKRKGKWKKKE